MRDGCRAALVRRSNLLQFERAVSDRHLRGVLSW